MPQLDFLQFSNIAVTTMFSVIIIMILTLFVWIYILPRLGIVENSISLSNVYGFLFIPNYFIDLIFFSDSCVYYFEEEEYDV